MQNHDDIFVYEKPKGKPSQHNSRHWLILALVMILGSSLALAFFSQTTVEDFAGTWEGLLYQDTGGYSPAYHFQLVIYRVDNNQVAGTAQIKIGDSSRENLNGIDDSYYGVMRFTGEFRAGVLYISDQTIVENDVMAGWEWCLKDYQLTVNRDTLGGDWQSPRTPGCAPGTLVLERQPDNGY